MKAQTILGLIALLSIHFAFLYPLFISDLSIPLYYCVVAIIFLLLISIGYLFELKNSFSEQSINALLPAYVILGAVSTFWMNNHLDLGPVIAAGSIGLLASFIPNIVHHPTAKDAPPAIYCGAFVGMSSNFIFTSYLSLLLASGIAGLLLLLTRNVFNGYGGKLGSIAFGGVACTILIIHYSC